MVYLPDGPTAYFKLTSIELSQKISVRALFPQLSVSSSQVAIIPLGSCTRHGPLP